MSLPPNAIVLGKGGTFKVPLGGFHGWMRVDDDAWVEDFCSGKTARMEYAATSDSEVVKMNRPEAPSFKAVVDEVASMSADIEKQKALENSVWLSEMPTPTEEQLAESRFQFMGPFRILPPDIHVKYVASYNPELEDFVVQENQADPHGIPQHEPGAKNDKGKMMASLVFSFPRALWAIGEAGTYGARKYTRDGWEKVPDGVVRYADAEARHLLLDKMEELDRESGLPHEWHRLWNALASLELSLREKE